MPGDAPATVDAYIATFPPEVRERLEAVRATIREAAPEAEETIAYGMPAYRLNGPLVYFAGHRKHVGFYPTPRGVEEFAADLAPYESGKGSAQFPHAGPIPHDLVARIVRFRTAENLEKAAAKKTRKRGGV